MKEEKTTLKRLKRLPALFRKQDTEKIAPHTGTFLSRAIKRGLIHRLNRGNYINSFLYGFPRVEEVACFLRQSAYISCEWALNYHGVSLQSPLVCTVLTLDTSVGKNRDFHYQGITIEFSRISPALFFGFSHIDNFHMALPEKAVLDTLYYRGMIPAQDELEMGELDSKSLLKMVDRYPPSVCRAFSRLSTLMHVDFLGCEPTPLKQLRRPDWRR